MWKEPGLRMRKIKDKKARLILVTGGAGYKGSTLCRELLFRGHRIRVLDNLMHGGRSLAGLFNHSNFEFIRGDITNPKDIRLSLEGVTDVIHLAAIVGDKPCERNPKLAIEINYKATQYLADSVKKKKINQFLFASTCSNYGLVDASVIATEDTELNPLSLYAETKIDCEKYLMELAGNGHFFPTILRFGTAYGVSGRTRFDLTVNSFTYEALKYKRLVVFAEETWRPYTHILDMARIYCKLLEADRKQVSKQIFNAGWNKQNYTKREIIDMMKDVIGDFEVDYVNTKDKRNYRVNFSKIEKLLSFDPVMTVKDGVRELSFAVKSGILTDHDFETNRLKQ